MLNSGILIVSSEKYYFVIMVIMTKNFAADHIIVHFLIDLIIL